MAEVVSRDMEGMSSEQLMALSLETSFGLHDLMEKNAPDATEALVKKAFMESMQGLSFEQRTRLIAWMKLHQSGLSDVLMQVVDHLDQFYNDNPVLKDALKQLEDAQKAKKTDEKRRKDGREVAKGAKFGLLVFGLLGVIGLIVVAVTGADQKLADSITAVDLENDAAAIETAKNNINTAKDSLVKSSDGELSTASTRAQGQIDQADETQKNEERFQERMQSMVDR